MFKNGWIQKSALGQQLSYNKRRADETYHSHGVQSPITGLPVKRDAFIRGKI